jgi:ubiquitin-conjugating enzyme E2 W
LLSASTLPASLWSLDKEKMGMNLRLNRELEKMERNPMEGICISSRTEKKDFTEVVLMFQGAERTLYDGQIFHLRMRFTKKYPIESPEVQFIDPVPVHPHIYSNGHICLSILYDEWSPALTAASVCLSILSMLSSCTEKKLPEGDEAYVSRNTGSSKNSKWLFDDDTV